MGLDDCDSFTLCTQVPTKVHNWLSLPIIKVPQSTWQVKGCTFTHLVLWENLKKALQKCGIWDIDVIKYEVYFDQSGGKEERIK